MSNANLTAISVATCNRPAHLERLLESFLSIQAPEGTALVFVIVDNGDPSTITDRLITGFKAQCPWPVEYVREPTRGIPYARNTILETALATDARYLVGLDDDELATPDWVIHHLAHLKRGEHALIGGPMDRMADPDIQLNRSEAWLLKALQHRAADDALERDQMAKERADFARVYTNNFGLDLDVVRRTGLRYDTALALSGGEDADFAERMCKLEGRLGWAIEAKVVEVLPRVRLQVSYHTSRNKELAIMMVQRKGWGRLKALQACIETGAMTLYLGLLSLFQGPGDKYWVLAKASRSYGYGLAALGRKSTHYAPETEHLR